MAAAIAALVEPWRREAGVPLPAALAFPAISPSRSVHCLFADAQNPGVLSYASDAADATADRMHAVEASLFMIGYDVGCLKENAPGAGIDDRQRARVERAGKSWFRQAHAGLPHKTISTRDGDKRNVTYAGDVDVGISGVWSKTRFAFESDFLQELQTDFAAAEAGLGASETGKVASDTLGFWIDRHYPTRSRVFASALAAILVTEGQAERIANANTIRLRFP